jgi:hypothetical protein
MLIPCVFLAPLRDACGDAPIALISHLLLSTFGELGPIASVDLVLPALVARDLSHVDTPRP